MTGRLRHTIGFTNREIGKVVSKWLKLNTMGAGGILLEVSSKVPRNLFKINNINLIVYRNVQTVYLHMFSLTCVH